MVGTYTTSHDTRSHFRWPRSCHFKMLIDTSGTTPPHVEGGGAGSPTNALRSRQRQRHSWSRSNRTARCAPRHDRRPATPANPCGAPGQKLAGNAREAVSSRRVECGGLSMKHQPITMLARPFRQLLRGGVVVDLDVAVGDKGPALVPAAPTMCTPRIESVPGAHDGTNIGVVFEILDGDVEERLGGGEVSFDSFDAPVAVLVDDIAVVAFGEEDRVETGIVRPRLRKPFPTRFRRGW